MAFEKLQVELRVVTGKTLLPASMSLSARQKGSVTLKVSLKPELAAEAAFVPKSRYDILIGRDDDAGKLRVVASPTGRVVGHVIKKSGGLGFYLGHVPAIGTKPHKRVQTDARVAAPGCVEIDIPDFGSAVDSKDRAPEAAAPIGASPVAKAKGIAANGETVNGITIDLTEDAETVTFRGKTTEVTTRQAKLVHLLARPRPAPVAASFLVNALWDGKPPGNAGKQIEEMAADLQRGLSPIGLNLCHVKGVGYQIKDL